MGQLPESRLVRDNAGKYPRLCFVPVAKLTLVVKENVQQGLVDLDPLAAVLDEA